MGEESHLVTKGIVHKYENRVLWKVSYRCAAHCQFCTRLRQIGTRDGDLNSEDIEKGLEYLSSHPEVNEVILSGGDPLFAPKVTEVIFSGLVQLPSVKVIRIGTRMPVHLPSAFEGGFLQGLLKKISEVAFMRPIYMLIHFDHPDELTSETMRVITQLRRIGLILLSQTVFLKGVNDDEGILRKLFESLYHAGVVPYYIYRCDYASGLERFVCSIQDERRIMTNLRRNLSGVAVPTYVIDVLGKGKIPVPLEFWDGVDLSQCKDFNGERILI
ncbi:MAG: radical SAM protein [bacterium]|nr:radical SAM protein [bacterium]